MDDYLAELCDELDAAVFTGDKLHNAQALKDFKEYLGRWNKEVLNIEATTHDETLA